MTREQRKQYNNELLSYYGLGPLTEQEKEVVLALTKFEEVLTKALEMRKDGNQSRNEDDYL